MRRALFALLLPGLLLADFRYEQSTRVTKGMILKMPFVKKPEAVLTTHYYKGGRMATASKDSTLIMDFDKQLITTIDHGKKQYWQLTFAEMQQRVQESMEEANKAGKQKNGSAEMKFEAQATGAEKEVSGFPAKQVIMTIEFVAKDQKSGQSGGMKMVSDSWHSEAVPGYAEYKKFLERMQGRTELLHNNPYANLMNQPGMAEGMKKMAEEMQKVPGIAVLTISRMGMPGGMNADFSQSGEAEGGNPQVDAGEAAKRAGGEAAGSTAGRAIGGRLGGVIGGGLGGRLGGFGRKKKNDEEAAQQEQAKQAEEQAKAQAPAADKNAEGMSVFMETLTDASNFSDAPISEEVFAIPAGYTKTEAELGRRRR